MNKRRALIPKDWYYAFAEEVKETYGIHTHIDLALNFKIPKDLARRLWLGDLYVGEFIYLCELLKIDPRKCIRQK